jgi:hypothetical protein
MAGTHSLTMLQQFLDACRHVSIDPRDELAPAKLLALNLRGTDRVWLFQTVFHDVTDERKLYVDWAKVPDMHRYVNSAGFWIQLLSKYCEVATPVSTDAVFSSATTQLLRTLLRRMGDAGLKTDWGHVVRVFVLMNIERVQSVHTVELYMNEAMRTPVQQNCMRLLSSMADVRYTPEEFAATMHWVIRRSLVVKTAALHADIDALQRNLDVSKQAMALRSLQTSNGRVRLRDRLAQCARISSNKAASGSLPAFQSAANFSVATSRNMQLRAYMLMSQVALDKTRALGLVLPPDLVRLVADKHVLDPDVSVITDIIRRMPYARAPFPELTEFHDRCFASIALSQKNVLTLTLIMQLYVSCYQSAQIWQECWKSVLPVMNAQLVRDVEAFRLTHPQMDVEAFSYSLTNFV